MWPERRLRRRTGRPLAAGPDRRTGAAPVGDEGATLKLRHGEGEARVRPEECMARLSCVALWTAGRSPAQYWPSLFSRTLLAHTGGGTGQRQGTVSHTQGARDGSETGHRVPHTGGRDGSETGHRVTHTGSAGRVRDRTPCHTHRGGGGTGQRRKTVDITLIVILIK